MNIINILTFSKTNFVPFQTTNPSFNSVNRVNNNKEMRETQYTKFLELFVNWKEHINQLLKKLSSATYAVRVV